MNEIDAACSAFAQQENLPGLLAGVVQDGALAHVTALGLADREAGRVVTPATAPKFRGPGPNSPAMCSSRIGRTTSRKAREGALHSQ